MVAVAKRFTLNKQSIILFLAGPLLMGAISVLSWALVGGGILRAPHQVDFVIPQGTAELIKQGQPVLSIPDKWVFVQGDVLAIRNQDTINHQLGPFWIPAQSTLSVPLNQASSFSYLCTAHPSSPIDLEVRPRDSLMMTLFPTLAYGLPMGLALVIIGRVLSNIKVE